MHHGRDQAERSHKIYLNERSEIVLAASRLEPVNNVRYTLMENLDTTWILAVNMWGILSLANPQHGQ